MHCYQQSRQALDYDEVASGLVKYAAAGTSGYPSLAFLPLRGLSTLSSLLLSFSLCLIFVFVACSWLEAA